MCTARKAKRLTVREAAKQSSGKHAKRRSAGACCVSAATAGSCVHIDEASREISISDAAVIVRQTRSFFVEMPQAALRFRASDAARCSFAAVEKCSRIFCFSFASCSSLLAQCSYRERATSLKRTTSLVNAATVDNTSTACYNKRTVRLVSFNQMKKKEEEFDLDGCRASGASCCWTVER